MIAVTRKHHYVERGLSRFAMVSVGRLESHGPHASPPQPEIVLNGHAVASITDEDRGVIEAARQGIRQAELELGWECPPHWVLKIEGLIVDGIDADAARLAAQAATKALIAV